MTPILTRPMQPHRTRPRTLRPPRIRTRLPLEDITRRDLLRRTGALGVGWILVGCGAGDETQPAAPAPAGPATRPFIDVTGRAVDVPNLAQRIVATHDINGGAQLLSLGAPVVGIARREDGFRDDVTRYFDLSDVMEVGATYEPDLETIAALDPDLIVHEGFNGQVTLDESVLDRLREMAPVVGIDTFRPVEQVMADFAALLGGAAVERYEQQKAELDGLIARLRAILGERWAEVTAAMVAPAEDGTLQAWGPTALPALDLMSRLGVRWVALQVEAGQPANGGYLGGISMERLPEFSADLILVETAYTSGVLDEPLYQRLPAVEAGQVVELSEPGAGSHFPNYIWTAERLLAGLEGLDLRTDLVA